MFYSLKFSYAGQSFKASEIGREFGYRSLQKNFEASQKVKTNAPAQEIHNSAEHTDTKNSGYQLVPPSRSYSPPPTKETMTLHECRIPLVQWQTPLLAQPMKWWKDWAI